MAMAASSSSSQSLMASQTLILQNSVLFHPLKPSTLLLSLSKPRNLCASKLPSLSLSTNPKKSLIVASSSSSSFSATTPTTSSELLLTGPNRTLATLAAVAVAVYRLFAEKLSSFALKLKLQENLVSTAGTLFFAAMKGRPENLNTPLTVVAAGMARWLEMYSSLLMVRVMLSWFPNIPWDRQPLSAMRDLCDPYLNLFRNIIPPVFNTLDVSPVMAMMILALFDGILRNTTMVL